MHSEEWQIQKLSSKSGTISEKTSSNDAKSKRRVQNFKQDCKIQSLNGNSNDEVKIQTMNFGVDCTPYPKTTTS